MAEFDPELAAFMDPVRIGQSREAQRARMAAADKAKQDREAAAARAEATALSHIASKLTLYRDAARELRTNQCGGCLSPTCARAAACAFQWDADVEYHQLDDQPLCKWAPQRHRIQSRALIRNDRMLRAGILNREMRDILAAAQTIEDALPVDRVSDPKHLAAPRRAAEAAERFVTTGCRSLFLYGSRGTFKTWALGWVVASIDDGVWITMSKVRPGEEWDALFRRASKSTLVALNDIGTEHASEWQRGEVMRLLNERDDDGKRTAVTSNAVLTLAEARERQQVRWDRAKRDDVNAPKPPLPDSIEAMYGDRITNRLASKGGGAIVECIIGPSLRDVMTEARAR